MEMKKILSLGERLQKLLDKTELEAQAIVSEAQKEADEIIRGARDDAEKRRLRAQRRTGLDDFLKEAEAEAKREAVRVRKEYSERAASIREVDDNKVEEAVSYLVEEVLPK